MSGARTISSVTGLPEFGREINTEYTSKNRAVVGWKHHDDTEAGRKHGKIWCWVSEGTKAQEKFQVFDEDFNRSPVPGDVRDCGVANFTMIRMFHPYWCPGDHIPKDMDSDDKKQCRELYKQLFRRRRINLGLPVDNDPDNPYQPPGQPRRRRYHRTRRERAAATVTDALFEENSAGEDKDGSMFFTDDEDSGTNDDRKSCRQSSVCSFIIDLTCDVQEYRANQISRQGFVNPIVIDDEDDSHENSNSDTEDQKITVEPTRDSAIDMGAPDVKMELARIDLTNDEVILIDLTEENEDDENENTEQQNLDESMPQITS